MTFYEGEIVRLTCKINVITFDPARHDLSDLGDEGCDVLPGPSRPLLSGTTTAVEFSRPYLEIGAGDESIVGVTPINSYAAYFTGVKPGATNIAVAFRGDYEATGSKRAPFRLCPVMVEDADAFFEENPIDDDELCIGASRTSARLRLGEDLLLETAVDDFEFRWIWHPSKILKMKRIDSEITKVTALAKGTTNVHYHAPDDGVIECWVIVE
ncbi:MAG: hypothetical protein AAFV19_09485 [Pseudomonadota bacterium]